MSYIICEIVLHLRVIPDLFCFVWRSSLEGPAWPCWSPRSLIDGAWLLFSVFWLIAALRSKPASRTEGSLQRLSHILFMAVGFVLLYDSVPPYLNWLNHSFVPERRWVGWLGAWLTLAGVLFAVWARITIGKEWSGEVQIKEGHQLIRSGLYAYIRHPIYTGLLVAVSGTALAVDEYRALLGVLVIYIGFARKAKKEESFLAAQFGPAFDAHRRQTGFFLPRLS